MTIEFIHLRPMVRRDRGPADPKRFEGDEPHAKGGVTIAFERRGMEVHWAVAWCSPKDNFNRRRGRLISAGRLRSQNVSRGGYSIVAVPAETKPAQVRRVVREQFFELTQGALCKR